MSEEQSQTFEWSTVEAVAIRTGRMDIRGLRNEVADLPPVAIRRNKGRLLIHGAYLAAGLFGVPVVARPKPTAPRRKPSRDRTIRRIVADWLSYHEQRRAEGARSTLAVDREFTLLYGHGTYPVRWRNGRTLRRWQQCIESGRGCRERRGRKRGCTCIGTDAWSHFIRLWVTERWPIVWAYHATLARANDRPDDPAWRWPSSDSTIYRETQVRFGRDFCRWMKQRRRRSA